MKTLVVENLLEKPKKNLQKFSSLVAVFRIFEIVDSKLILLKLL